MAKHTNKRKRSIIISVVTTLIATTAAFAVVLILLYGKIFPNIFVANTNLGGLTREKAAEKLQNAPKSKEIKITIASNNKKEDYLIPLDKIEVNYNIEKTVQNAYQTARTGDIKNDINQFIQLLSNGKDIGWSVQINKDKLAQYLQNIESQSTSEPTYPSISIVNKEIVIQKGEVGEKIETKELTDLINQAILYQNTNTIEFKATQINPSLSDTEVESVKNQLKNLIGKNVSVVFEDKKINLSDSDLVKILFPYNTEDEITKKTLELKQKLDTQAQNPTFVFDGNKVKEFTPAKPGISVNTDALEKELLAATNELLTSETSEVEITAQGEILKPSIETDKVNNIGIKELIGKGNSLFRGSIPSRVHNVELAASRVNGTLVAPGQTFSFNEVLGDVSKFTGFKEAYVIQDGKTVLGDGGGVCQVSSTLFRAVLNAGLPITERRAHSYRVGYYEQGSQPGLDATVYSPSTDFKFKNDTENHILIQAKTDTKNMSLVFELYGTSDGRVSHVSKSTTTNVVAPPEDTYVDDPTLSIGTVKQIEHKAWGAKVVFNYEVTRAGETIYKKTFISNYKPWQAVFLKGTKQ